MEKKIKQYAERTGAKEVVFLVDTEKYGKVWELRYGGILENGKVEPTGLPVLVFIFDGDVAVMSSEEALDLLADLDE